METTLLNETYSTVRSGCLIIVWTCSFGVSWCLAVWTIFGSIMLFP